MSGHTQVLDERVRWRVELQDVQLVEATEQVRHIAEQATHPLPLAYCPLGHTQLPKLTVNGLLQVVHTVVDEHCVQPTIKLEHDTHRLFTSNAFPTAQTHTPLLSTKPFAVSHAIQLVEFVQLRQPTIHAAQPEPVE